MTNATKPDALEMLRDLISASRINDQGRGRYFVREIKPEHLEPIMAALEAERHEHAEECAAHLDFVSIIAARDAKIRELVTDARYEVGQANEGTPRLNSAHDSLNAILALLDGGRHD